jgi:hypothetical protein
MSLKRNGRPASRLHARQTRVALSVRHRQRRIITGPVKTGSPAIQRTNRSDRKFTPRFRFISG